MILVSGPASIGDLVLMVGVSIGLPLLILYLLYQVEFETEKALQLSTT